MRSFALALGLLFSLTVFAKSEVQLSPLSPNNAKGSITIDESDALSIEYRLEGLSEHTNYAVFIYTKGNCKNYSDQIIPYVKSEGVISKVNEPENFLVDTASGNFNFSYGGMAKDSTYRFFDIDFKGKILVLEEIRGGKSTGHAVACGIHP